MKINKLLIILVLLSTSCYSQINKPSLSPKIKTEQKVGLANINLEYGQPSKNNRIIFGSLIPYNKIWRTGANASTKISFDKDIYLDKNKIPAGTYGLYTIPNKKNWTIIIHKKSNLWGAGGYNKMNDLVRFEVPVIKTTDNYETLNIGFEKFTINGAELFIRWEKTKINIPVTVNSDVYIQNQIDEKIINAKQAAKPQTYYDAALFYYQKNKQLELAFEWFTKATELRPNAFWYTYYRAELAHKLGKNDIAENDAKKCLIEAKKSKSSDYGYIAKCSLLLKKVLK